MRCALIVIMVLAAQAAPAQQKQKLFVTSVRAPQLDSATRAALFDLIVVAANRAGTFDVVTIDDIDQEIAQEKRKDALACSNMTCAVELSGALGVRYLLAGRAEKLGDDVLVTVSLIDTVEQRSVTGQGRGTAKADTLARAVDAGVAEALGVMRVDLFDPRTNVCKVGEAPGPDCAGQCNKGIGDSCAALGRAYWDGIGTTARDPDKARAYLERACNAKSALGCVDLGRLLSRMPPSHVDKPRAADAFKRACDLGNPAGCGYLAAAYRRGFGVPVDFVKARQLATPACAASDGHGVGCAVLGRMMLNGEGAVRDSTHAPEIFRRGCDQGNSAACDWLGEAHLEHGSLARDDVLGAAYLRRGCTGLLSNRDSAACTSLGDLYLEGRGGLKVDVDKAVELYAMACETDASPAVACAWLGIHYLRGTLVPIDEARAVPYLKRACLFEHAEACAELKSVCDGGRKDACR